MKQAAMVSTFTLLFALCLVLAGCMSTLVTSDGSFQIEGLISYKEPEGGFWAIDADDGARYLPLNLPESFRQDRMRVRVEAVLQPDVMTIHMYGNAIEIVHIDKIE